MSEQVKSAKATNSITQLPIPFGDINNRRFVTALMAGVVGGAGVSAAANLLRKLREVRKAKSDETDDETIVLTLPKSAADAYTSMKDAKPGETKVTANGGNQFRDGGKYGAKITAPKTESKAVKEADGNPGPNSVGTVVANAIGLTAGGVMSYEVVSRIFDALQERRLKRKLKAAQEAYVNAMSGASKRAEMVMAVIRPVEHVLCKEPVTKIAGISDILPDAVTNPIRYPAAAYILSLLAGAGATAYITKKVMDREFPEEKLKQDINRPTRIVFRTSSKEPEILEGEEGEEKKASAETCAAITALLPVYMDIVEGRPNRTLAEPYVKLAAAAGTDPAGLMKIAASDMSKAYSIILHDPSAVVSIMTGTSFGLSFSKKKMADKLRKEHPETYRKAVDAAIDAHFASDPTDGFMRRAWNNICRLSTKAFANLGGRDYLVSRALKSASVIDMIGVRAAIQDALTDKDKADEDTFVPENTKAVASKARKRLKGHRRLSVQAADPAAAAYIAKNRDRIQKLLVRLNAQGTI